MMGAREIINAMSATAAVPAPTHIKISGAMATMGTVCNKIVYGYSIRRTQRDCAKKSATITPTTMLAARPAPDSTAVIDNADSNDGKRATTARATAQGEGSMYCGIWKIHKMSCHNTSSAAKTPSALTSVVNRCLIVLAPPAARAIPARRAPQTPACRAMPPCAATANQLEAQREYGQDSTPARR